MNAFYLQLGHLMATLNMGSALREECLDKVGALGVRREADRAVSRGESLAQVQCHGLGVTEIVN